MKRVLSWFVYRTTSLAGKPGLRVAAPPRGRGRAATGARLEEEEGHGEVGVRVAVHWLVRLSDPAKMAGLFSRVFQARFFASIAESLRWERTADAVGRFTPPGCDAGAAG